MSKLSVNDLRIPKIWQSLMDKARRLGRRFHLDPDDIGQQSMIELDTVEDREEETAEQFLWRVVWKAAGNLSRERHRQQRLMESVRDFEQSTVFAEAEFIEMEMTSSDDLLNRLKHISSNDIRKSIDYISRKGQGMSSQARAEHKRRIDRLRKFALQLIKSGAVVVQFRLPSIIGFAIVLFHTINLWAHQN